MNHPRGAAPKIQNELFRKLLAEAVDLMSYTIDSSTPEEQEDDGILGDMVRLREKILKALNPS